MTRRAVALALVALGAVVAASWLGPASRVAIERLPLTGRTVVGPVSFVAPTGWVVSPRPEGSGAMRTLAVLASWAPVQECARDGFSAGCALFELPPAGSVVSVATVAGPAAAAELALDGWLRRPDGLRVRLVEHGRSPRLGADAWLSWLVAPVEGATGLVRVTAYHRGPDLLRSRAIVGQLVTSLRIEDAPAG